MPHLNSKEHFKLWSLLLWVTSGLQAASLQSQQGTKMLSLRIIVDREGLGENSRDSFPTETAGPQQLRWVEGKG